MSRGFVGILKNDALHRLWAALGTGAAAATTVAVAATDAAAAMVQQNKRCCRTLRIGT